MIKKSNRELNPTKPISDLAGLNPDDMPKAEFTARWIDSVDELESLRPEWELLMNAAIHRNLMLDPDFLIPAFKYFADQSVRILVIEAPRKKKPQGSPVICALLPLQTKQIYAMPLRSMEIWSHDQSADCTPLLRSACASTVVNFLFDFLAEDERIQLLSLETVSNSGQFAEVLTDALSARKTNPFFRDSFTRACFRPESDAETYFSNHVSKSVQRTQRRLSRRLEEKGDITVTCYRDPAFSESMIENFLRLEASGWKATAGSAIGCDTANEGFFREMVTRSMQRDKISFLTLNLNGEPISMLCDLYSGSLGYAYKTAYDDGMKEFSPGMMAELRNIEYLHETPVRCIDSCTAPDNETINRIWGDRLRFQSLVIPLKGKVARWSVATMPLLQQLKTRK